jgi:TPR repeat protein
MSSLDSLQEWIKGERLKAKNGDAVAQFNLGCCCFAGNGVAKDIVQAASWWRKAAEQGHADAQNNLATCYADGIGLNRDLAQAAFWYQMAAEQGHGRARGQAVPFGGCN